MATYAKVTEVQVGTPATYNIGSDCYATAIASVTYYKSGDLKGFVKSVTDERGNTYRPYAVTRFGEPTIDWRKSAQQWWGTLTLGFAVTRLDPHF